MKLQSVTQARSVWLFSVSDLNPRGRALERNALIELATRYRFLKPPEPTEIVTSRDENKGLRYTAGVFHTEANEDVAVDLVLYRDGFLVDTRASTDTSDAFAEDMLSWLTNTFELRSHRELLIRRVYVSEVIVTMNHHLELLNPKLRSLSNALAEKLKGRSPSSHTELASIAFWQDGPQTNLDLAFRLERAADSTFEQRRFWSNAPLSTSDHLELLTQFEAALE